MALEKQHIFYLAKHLKISVRYKFLKTQNAHKNLNLAPKVLKKYQLVGNKIPLFKKKNLFGPIEPEISYKY